MARGYGKLYVMLAEVEDGLIRLSTLLHVYGWVIDDTLIEGQQAVRRGGGEKVDNKRRSPALQESSGQQIQQVHDGRMQPHVLDQWILPPGAFDYERLCIQYSKCLEAMRYARPPAPSVQSDVYCTVRIQASPR